jgi:hypothetical protein
MFMSQGVVEIHFSMTPWLLKMGGIVFFIISMNYLLYGSEFSCEANHFSASQEILRIV